MSLITKKIERDPYIEVIRDVFLNREGRKIGQIVRFGIQKRIVYLSKRSREHYFIKHRGFGLDSVLLKNLITEHEVDRIVILYQGVRGRRYFVSNIDDWIMHGKNVGYAKEKENDVETYGKQKILCEDYMKELEVM